MAKRVCGIGINDMSPCTWTSEFKRKYDCWRSMLNRLANNPNYVNCTCVDEWKYLSNFISDIKSIPGYNLWLANPGDYELDKDIKVPGNTVYGPSTCLFVSCSDNTRDRNARRGHPSTNPVYNLRAHLPERNHKCALSEGTPCYGVSPTGEVFIGYGYGDLARKIGASVAVVSETCRGKYGRNLVSKGKFSGWQFYNCGSGIYPEVKYVEG